LGNGGFADRVVNGIMFWVRHTRSTQVTLIWEIRYFTAKGYTYLVVSTSIYS